MDPERLHTRGYPQMAAARDRVEPAPGTARTHHLVVGGDQRDRAATGLHEDLAWSYRFTTDAVRAIAGPVAFYDESVDVVVDGVAQDRRDTRFSS